MGRHIVRMLASAVVLNLVPTIAVAVESCPFGQVLKCSRPYWHRPPTCRCVGPGFAPGGKAEIHKKNVPTVKPNKSTGGY